MTLRYYKRLTRHFSRGRGKASRAAVAMCSRCKAAVAHWLIKRGYHQRYYCDECIKVTKTWKANHEDKEDTE